MKKKALGVLVALMATTALVGCGNKKNDNQPTPTTSPEVTPEVTPEASDEIPQYEGYKLMWNDEFDGDTLSIEDWNYETHEAGWVNAELQEYIRSESVIQVADGKLIIKPQKASDKYYSGRINTQGKHDFKYGRFEAKIKVPEGQGYLPAFWMMPTEESIYGQWPKCGEIDIMEVMGQKTNLAYCTVHYGAPHRENQGTYKAELGHSFSAEFHTYAVDWEPGRLTWYIDGYKVYTTNEWYTKTDGQGTITYPAPFDQDFYMILNLAIGGSWVGYPDDEAIADMPNQQMEVDWVRVYQRDSYDENVKLEEKVVVVRDPDESGNYVENGTFESMDKWTFLTAQEGDGKAKVENNQMIIESTAAGKVDYSVQLVQANIPLVKNGAYKISFDAYASEARSTKIAVKAPDNGWAEYFPTTIIDLGTEKKHYEYNFVMKNGTDSNGRLEFNNGAAGSTATIYIENVRFERTDDGSGAGDGKEVLIDGNYLYNGKFQEGDDHIGFWEFEKDDTVKVFVSDLKDNRRLTLNVASTPVKVFQGELGVVGKKGYAFSVELEGPKDSVVKFTIFGKDYEYTCTGGKDKFAVKIDASSLDKIDDPSVAITVTAAGTTYIDNIMLQEDILLKNGDFSSDWAGYEVYIDSQADATYGIDSISEGNDNTAEFTINKTGGDDWRIQLKQNHVLLEQGKSYKMTWDARSNKERYIRVIMQGGEPLDWPVYSTDNVVQLNGDMKWQHFECEFTMEAKTDSEAFLSICMGAVTEKIEETHKVDIDNITLVEVE